jgi:hypothetical protein
VYRNIWLTVPPGTHWKDVAWLCFGVSVNSRDLDSMQPAGVLIGVHQLTYPLSDYRAEVAALAMDGWLHEEFSLPPSSIQLTVDRHGTAEFDWGIPGTPFADPTG